jgi:energy-coupling factor transporter ATP-binding protein EcfA2
LAKYLSKPSFDSPNYYIPGKNPTEPEQVTVHTLLENKMFALRWLWPEVAEFLDAEKKTWVDHSLKYDGTIRESCLAKLSDFKIGSKVHLGYTAGSQGNVEYQHWFVTNGTSYLEFGAASLSIYGARVQINNNTREYSIQGERKDEKRVDAAMIQRMRHVLGLKNYSLCLRNCEHVANYVFHGKWISNQMSTQGDLWKLWFKDHMMDHNKRLVNSFPSDLRPHEFKEGENKTYSFVDGWYTAENFEYYLDHEEKTYNILVFGPTGSGKSHLINMMFGRQICESKSSLNAVTRDIYFVRGKGRIGSKLRNVVVTDTIGLCDTEFSEEHTDALLKDRISANCKKVDAVYIVIHKDRLLPAYKKAITSLLDWLEYSKGNNKNYFNFIITHTEGEDDDAKERLKQEARDLLDLGDTKIRTSIPGRYYETLTCVGFPRERILGQAGKEDVRRSFERLQTMQNAGMLKDTSLPVPRGKKDRWCSIM